MKRKVGHNATQLTDLLKGDLGIEITSWLNFKEICQVIGTSHTTLGLFHLSEVARLSQAVLEADYITAERLVKKNPNLIFQKIKVSYSLNNNTDSRISSKKHTKFLGKVSQFLKTAPAGEQQVKEEYLGYLSPLELSFKLLDTPMWQLFELAISHNPIFVKNFNERLSTFDDYINLDDFFTGYNKYNQAAQAFLNDQINKQQMDQAWKELGGTQKEFLFKTVSLWREFFKVGDDWNTLTNKEFADGRRPSGNLEFLGSGGEKKSISVKELAEGLGRKFTFARGAELTVQGGITTHGPRHVWNRKLITTSTGLTAPAGDCIAFSNLYSIRLEELNARKQQILEKTLCPKPSM